MTWFTGSTLRIGVLGLAFQPHDSAAPESAAGRFGVVAPKCCRFTSGAGGKGCLRGSALPLASGVAAARGAASLVVLHYRAGVRAGPLRDSTDWAIHIGQAVLLLERSAWRRFTILTAPEPNRWPREQGCRRIVSRRHWPHQLGDRRGLPEVAVSCAKPFATKCGRCCALLSDSARSEIHAAALGALEYRPRWQPGEAELVLKTARESHEPAVRVARSLRNGRFRRGRRRYRFGFDASRPGVEVRAAAAEAPAVERGRPLGLARGRRPRRTGRPHVRLRRPDIHDRTIARRGDCRPHDLGRRTRPAGAAGDSNAHRAVPPRFDRRRPTGTRKPARRNDARERSATGAAG